MTTLEQDKVDPGKSDFPRPSRETWTQAAAASNGGLSADRLISQTYEGITVQPLYVHDDIELLEAVRTIPGRPPYMRGGLRSPLYWRPSYPAARPPAALAVTRKPASRSRV